MRKRIMLVDDDIDLTRSLKRNLEQQGDYEVQVVNWAEDALTVAREFKPHVVVLDVKMPRAFGGDVAERLRAEPSLQRTAIVFLSGTVDRDRVAEHDGVIGGFPFLAKPATFEELSAFIERNLPEDASPG